MVAGIGVISKLYSMLEDDEFHERRKYRAGRDDFRFCRTRSSYSLRGLFLRKLIKNDKYEVEARALGGARASHSS